MVYRYSIKLICIWMTNVKPCCHVLSKWTMPQWFYLYQISSNMHALLSSLINKSAKSWREWQEWGKNLQMMNYHSISTHKHCAIHRSYQNHRSLINNVLYYWHFLSEISQSNHVYYVRNAFKVHQLLKLKSYWWTFPSYLVDMCSPSSPTGTGSESCSPGLCRYHCSSKDSANTVKFLWIR